MLTLNKLAETLAELTGCSPADAEFFLREVFQLATEEIESEGAVEVPFLGRFAISEQTVVFQPDEDFAAAVNSPFADFSPVELPEGFRLDDGEENPEPESESAAEEEPSPAEDEVMPEEPAAQEEEEPAAEEPTVFSEAAEIAETPATVSASEPELEPTRAEVIVRRKGVSYCAAVLIGLLCVIGGFAGGWFARQYVEYQDIVLAAPVAAPIEDEPEELPAVDEPEAEDDPVEPSEGEELTERARVAVTDTVRQGRFLTTMARQHYGQMDYWVYIYEANAGTIGNPDMLEAGTVVIIPPADSLGLEPDNAEKIAEAKRKAREIYGRFN